MVPARILPAMLLPLLVAGMCGSVLRGFAPAEGKSGPSGGWAFRFGDLEVEASVLAVHGEAAYGHFTLRNRGSVPILLEAVDLGPGLPWEPPGGKALAVDPGGMREVDPLWSPAPEGKTCEAVLKIRVGDELREIRIPFRRD